MYVVSCTFISSACVDTFFPSLVPDFSCLFWSCDGHLSTGSSIVVIICFLFLFSLFCHCNSSGGFFFQTVWLYFLSTRFVFWRCYEIINNSRWYIFIDCRDFVKESCMWYIFSVSLWLFVFQVWYTLIFLECFILV